MGILEEIGDSVVGGIKRVIKWLIYIAIILFGSGFVVGLFFGNSPHFYIVIILLVIIIAIELVDIYVDNRKYNEYKKLNKSWR